MQKDNSARGGVVVDEKHTLEVLYFQMGHVRNLYEKFPDILLVDGTYNVNGQGMPLYCLITEDGLGHGVLRYNNRGRCSSLAKDSAVI